MTKEDSEARAAALQHIVQDVIEDAYQKVLEKMPDSADVDDMNYVFIGVSQGFLAYHVAKSVGITEFRDAQTTKNAKEIWSKWFDVTMSKLIEQLHKKEPDDNVQAVQEP